ncbi:MAG: hypothetical protein AAGC77_02460 [Pseudomonadota bacterium]
MILAGQGGATRALWRPAGATWPKFNRLPASLVRSTGVALHFHWHNDGFNFRVAVACMSHYLYEKSEHSIDVL